MTLAQMRTEVWEALGEPTDIDPSSDSTRIDRWINEGQRRVAFYKDPSGRRPRFRELFSELYFQSNTVTGTVESGATTTSIPLDESVGASDDKYNGWVLEISDEAALVVDYDGGTTTATVHDDYSMAPTEGDSYTLYKRFWLVVPSTHDWADDHISLPAESDIYRSTGNLLAPLRITDLEDRIDLDRGTRVDTYSSWETSPGDPREWIELGNRIVFDRPLNEAKWFRMEYYRLPTALSAATDTPELPEQYHWPIVLWALWWGFKRNQDFPESFSAERDFEKMMASLVDPVEVSTEREDIGGIVRL